MSSVLESLLEALSTVLSGIACSMSPLTSLFGCIGAGLSVLRMAACRFVSVFVDSTFGFVSVDFCSSVLLTISVCLLGPVLSRTHVLEASTVLLISPVRIFPRDTGAVLLSWNVRNKKMIKMYLKSTDHRPLTNFFESQKY